MENAVAAAVTSPEWSLLYHMPGKIKGRGEFLRLMLEDAGVTYDDVGEHIYGPTGCMDAFRGSPEAIAADEKEPLFPFPCLFPPTIWHRPQDGEEVFINQVGACMIYLGDSLGYAPSSIAESARANSILLNALDYITEGRKSFHPVQNTMSYHDQKEEGDKISKEFTESRLPTFLHHFHKVVLKNGPNQPVAGGFKVTYADFALFHVLDATIAQFNSDYYGNSWDKSDTPALKEFHSWFKSRPKLQAYFASSRCAPFAGDSMM